MVKHKVLSTKKLKPSLVELAKENGIEITEQEFISVEPIKDLETFQQIFVLLKKPFAAFTSANAVTSLANFIHPNAEDDLTYMPAWKIFCLSGKTKEAILNVKHLRANIIAEAENARDLAKQVIEQDIAEIVFFCGNKRRDELPVMLKNAGIKTNEVVVYETVETPVISNNDFDAVLFFSPSAVQSFFSVNQLKNNVVCFAIGQTTAESIAAFAKNKIFISKTTSQEALLQEVINYFKSMVSQN